MNDFWKEKKVLITGINGFVGANLAKSLAHQGASVYGLIRNYNPHSFLYFEKVNKKICEEALNFFYFFGFIKENQTIIEEIKSFEPGYLYEVDFENNVSNKKIFNITDIFNNSEKDFSDLSFEEMNNYWEKSKKYNG